MLLVVFLNSCAASLNLANHSNVDLCIEKHIITGFLSPVDGYNKGGEIEIMKNDNERIGYNLRGAVLRYCAKNRGVTQKQIALGAGVHPVTLSRILNGEGTSIKTMERIAAVVGADPVRILEKGRRTPKYTARSLDEVIGDDRILRQFVGETDDRGLQWAGERLRHVVSELEKHRLNLQRDRAYYV